MPRSILIMSARDLELPFLTKQSELFRKSLGFQNPPPKSVLACAGNSYADSIRCSVFYPGARGPDTRDHESATTSFLLAWQEVTADGGNWHMLTRERIAVNFDLALKPEALS